MSKYSRSGGKFGGTHTTLTPAASIIADIAAACSVVTKISPGFLKAGLRPVNKRRIKIADNGTRILLSVRDTASHQEVHVYATDTANAAKAIAHGAKDAGFLVSLSHKNS